MSIKLLVSDSVNSTVEYEVYLGYVDVKTNTPYLLVKDSESCNGIPKFEIKRLDCKEKVFKDELRHLMNWSLREKVLNANPGEEFECEKRPYKKLCENEVKELCSDYYSRPSVTVSGW